MRRSESEDVALEQTDCQEIALALRVLAQQIETEAGAEADGDELLAAGSQVERLRNVAEILSNCGRLDFCIEGVLKSLEDKAASSGIADAGILAFGDADLRTAAQALRMLAGRLRVAGDQHAKRIDGLAEKVAMGAEYLTGLGLILVELEAASAIVEREEAGLPPEEQSG